MPEVPPGPEWRNLTVTAALMDGHAVLRMAGTLDAHSYRDVRDRIVKAAMDEPRSVIIDANALVCPVDSAWSVLTAARWLIYDWPGVPLSVACRDQSRRRLLRRGGICRYVPVFDDVQSALDVQRPQRLRLRSRLALPAHPDSVALARIFVAMWLTRWERTEMITAAGLVVTELVENVLEHTSSQPRIRIETDGSTIVIAVEDDDPGPARVREGPPGEAPMGLRIVGQLCSTWRNAPTADGKVVWAALDASKRI